MWENAQAIEDAGGVEELIGASDIAERHDRLAAAYANAYAEEVAGQVAENRLQVDELRRRHPTFEAAT